MFTSELILDYVESLEVEGGRSAKTAENYKLYLERFVEFTEDIKVEAITTETVRKYRLWLNRYKNESGEGLSIITQVLVRSRYRKPQCRQSKTAKSQPKTSQFSAL
jgi:site-specific recombinase XerD